METIYERRIKKAERISKIKEKMELRIKGKRGAPEKRVKIDQFIRKLYDFNGSNFYRSELLKMQCDGYRVFQERKMSRKEWTDENQRCRLNEWKKQSCFKLAKTAEQYFDEHGFSRGDYLSTNCIDFIPPRESINKPFWDMGGEGLGLIEITRKRVYARSYRFGPGYASTKYFIGKNEAGTYFSHPVPNHCQTVRDAIHWIWEGKEDSIIARQGDIALIIGKGNKIPKNFPNGHEIVEKEIIHKTHPAIRFPEKGERIIVGRRAFARVSEATRD